MSDFQHANISGYFTAHVNGINTANKNHEKRSYYRIMLNDVFDRIQSRLDKVNLSATAASLKAGLSRDAIRNIQRAVKANSGRKGVSTGTIAALAPILQTTQAWLLDGTGPEEAAHEIKQSVLSYVPLISWVSAGELSHQDGVEDFSGYPTVATADLPNGDWIALRVDGPSMNKISPPDSIILVNRDDKRLVTNGCYVITDETGQATYKRYRPNDAPPFQPASYKDIPAPKLDGIITVIGRVRRSIIDM